MKNKFVASLILLLIFILQGCKLQYSGIGVGIVGSYIRLCNYELDNGKKMVYAYRDRDLETGFTSDWYLFTSCEKFEYIPYNSPIDIIYALYEDANPSDPAKTYYDIEISGDSDFRNTTGKVKGDWLIPGNSYSYSGD